MAEVTNALTGPKYRRRAFPNALSRSLPNRIGKRSLLAHFRNACHPMQCLSPGARSLIGVGLLTNALWGPGVVRPQATNLKPQKLSRLPRNHYHCHSYSLRMERPLAKAPLWNTGAKVRSADDLGASPKRLPVIMSAVMAVRSFAKARWWGGLDSNQRKVSLTELQSVAFDHSATHPLSACAVVSGSTGAVYGAQGAASILILSISET